MHTNDQESLENIQVIPPELPPSFPQENNNWQKKMRFSFSGNTSEYFGIWIVNILLTIVTIGIYAPWAKVRRLRYFYGNTEFFNKRFDFTGIPSKILIGRLIALGLYFAISLVANYSVTATFVGLGVLYLLVPWLIRATLRFNARNSKFGNSRFYFSGTTKGSYTVFFLSLILTIFTLGLCYPISFWLYKRYAFDHLYVGQLKFNFKADWSAFMAAFYYPFLIMIAMFCCIGLIMWLISAEFGLVLFGVAYFLIIFFANPLILARMFIATWNNITLGNSEFSTDCNQWHFAWIVGSNWIVRILTLGLMTPWAAIRLYRYQVESLQLDLRHDPDDLLNRIQQDHSALAEEISDIFDIDISL